MPSLPTIDDPLPQGPLRVLLFTALPDDLDPETERLDTESEQANVLEALNPLIQQGNVRLTTPDDGRFSHLQTLLREQAYHLVFLIGHGTYRDNALTSQPPTAYFLFEGEDGHRDPVEAKTLAGAFQGTAVQCVVLSACESGKSASDDLNTGLTLSLLNSGLAHVVGMRESVLDVAGIQFAQALCAALGRQERLDVALQDARDHISQPFKSAGRWRDPAKQGLAEATFGQWCLPLLLSRDAARPFIDWNFDAQLVVPPLFRYDELAGIPLPQTFIGRRQELRDLGRQLAAGETHQILITGAGGQGKTSLAGRLAQRLDHQGYWVRAYTARKENTWNAFVNELRLGLDAQLAEQMDRRWVDAKTEQDRAQLLIRTLVHQTQNKLVLFFDNLETVQHPETGAITDPILANWLAACAPDGPASPVLLLTSRWAIPDWEATKERTRHQLNKPSYGDFLRFHQQLGSTEWQAERLRRLYTALNGNFKGLEFFHALEQTDSDDEAFLQRLEHSQTELQLYMAVEALYNTLSDREKTLLNRLRAYHAPVIVDGVRVVAEDLEPIDDALHRLSSVSLVDVEYDRDIRRHRYHVSPVVADWLQARHAEPDQDLKQRAARYQHWVFEHLQGTLTQVLIAHEALQRADLDEDAATVALDTIVPHFDRRGLFHTLLNDWLPDLRQSQSQKLKAHALNRSGKIALHTGDFDSALIYLQDALAITREIGHRSGEGDSLNNISQIYKARGDYDSALDYLQNSLAVRHEIGDRRGMCATLINLGHTYIAKNDNNEALGCFVVAYQIARDIGWAEALQNLEHFSNQMGGDGLEAWERLAKQMMSN